MDSEPDTADWLVNCERYEKCGGISEKKVPLSKSEFIKPVLFFCFISSGALL